MRKKTGLLLKCLADQSTSHRFFGIDVLRNGQLIHQLEHEQLLDEDDIITGILFFDKSSRIYPISHAIGLMLSDDDLDTNHYLPLMQELQSKVPPSYHSAFATNIAHIEKANITHEGNWNRDEMRYYDKEVDTAELRKKMTDSVNHYPIWRIFLPRKKYITDPISKEIKGTNLLEIGCGNARTVCNIFRPQQYHYQYTGTDISFKRLMVAKSVVPEGDFIQASALELPFRNNIFHAILSFGMLHHLSRPAYAVGNSIPLISMNGLFCFHEPFHRPAVNLPGVNTFRKAVTRYEHSEHDSKIDLEELEDVLVKSGFQKVLVKKQNSFIRAFTESIIKKIPGKLILNKGVIQFLESTDIIFNNTIGKISRRLGPGTAYVIMRKIK